MQNILAEALVVWREPGYLEELLSFKIKIWTKLNLWSFGAINWSKVAWRKQLSRTHSTDGNQDTSSVPHDRRIGVKSYGDKLTILEQNQTKSADRSATSKHAHVCCAGPPACAHRMNYEHQLATGRLGQGNSTVSFSTCTLHVHLLVLASQMITSYARVVLGILYQAS